MAIEEDPFFGKTPPPIHLPEIIPVQAIQENEDSDLWADQRPHYRPSARFLLALLVFGLAGLGGIYLASRPNNPLDSAANQVNSIANLPIPTESVSSPKPTTQASNQSALTNSIPTLISTDASCNLPLYRSQTLGFQIGQPAQWSVVLAGPVIMVVPDNNFQTVSFLLPIELADQNLAESVTKLVTNTLQQSFENFGARFTLANSELTGTIKGVPSTGWLTSYLTNSGFVIRGGWAPSSDYPSQRQILNGIGDCYQPALGTVLQVVAKAITDDQGTTVFRAAYPPDWVMTNISSLGFDLGAAADASIRYQHVDGLLGSQTTIGLFEQALSSTRYQELTILADGPVAEIVDNQGLTWQTQARSYTARVNGQLLRGTITAAVLNNDDGFGFGSYAAITINRETEWASWPEFEPLSVTIQESLKFTNPQAGQGLTLPATDPGARTAPIDGRVLSATLTDQLGASGRPILGNYRSAQASNGDLFLAPETNFEAKTQTFVFDRGGQRDMLSPVNE